MIVFAAAMALAIACGTTANIVVISLRQTLVPDELLGRVNSFYRVAFATAAPLGALAAGQLAGLVSLRAPLLLMGAGSHAASLASIARRTAASEASTHSHARHGAASAASATNERGNQSLALAAMSLRAVSAQDETCPLGAAGRSGNHALEVSTSTHQDL